LLFFCPPPYHTCTSTHPRSSTTSTKDGVFCVRSSYADEWREVLLSAIPPPRERCTTARCTYKSIDCGESKKTSAQLTRRQNSVEVWGRGEYFYGVTRLTLYAHYFHGVTRLTLCARTSSSWDVDRLFNSAYIEQRY